MASLSLCMYLTILPEMPNSESVPSKPEQFERMKSLASKLCQGFPHVRVDFYIVDNKIYFGELTFFHNGGFQKIYPSTWNLRLGNWIIMPKWHKKIIIPI